MIRRTSALVGLAAFGVYALLCAPVSGPGDSSELDLVLALNGVAHPTGYPLYTLVGHLFCAALHALGAPWPLAANLFSAAGAAVAIGLLHALARELGRDAAPGTRGGLDLAAVVPIALFAFQPVLVAQATVAEVNSWSLAWSCGAAYAFVRALRAASADAGPRPRLVRRAAEWGLVCGLGLAHHLTSVLISAPLSAGLVAALIGRGRRSPGELAAATTAAVAGALLPLSSYATIAVHAWHPALVQWPALHPTLASVVAHVTGSDYRHFLGQFSPSAADRERVMHVVVPFLAVGLPLQILALVRAKRPNARIAVVALLAATVCVSAFTFGYGVPDPAAYFLPAMALCAAAAAPALAGIAGVRRGDSWRLIAAALLALVPIVPWLRDAVRAKQDHVRREAMIRSMWEAIPPDTAIVLWPDDQFIHLQEYQLLLGEKPALFVTMPDMLADPDTRGGFRARFGFDPTDGMPPPPAGGGTMAAPSGTPYLNRLVDHVNARVRVPVIVFDPSVPTVRRLRKPIAAG